MIFSLVIPCYNEAASLPLLVARCKKLTARGDVEVVLVDNGSTDDSQQVLRELLGDVPHLRSVRVEKNQGYGYGILCGLHAAEGDFLGWTHADLQTDPMDVLCGLDLLIEDEKAGIESAFVKGRRYGRPVGDTMFTVAMSLFETLLLRVPLWDINAQPTLFSRAFFLTWQDPPADFSLDLYAYYQARRQKLSVRRFPTRFGARQHGRSHWNVDWAAKRKFIKRTVDFSIQLKKTLKP